MPIRSATALTAAESQQQQSIPPRLRGRDYARISGTTWVALPYQLDKYGYPVKSTSETWEKVRDQDRQWYQYIVFRARKTGVAWPSYATMADDRECCIETAQRYMRRLAAFGFITIEHDFDKKSGDFTSNRYTPHNPLEPQGDALAIQYRGQSIRCKIGAIPPLPAYEVRRGKPKTPHAPPQDERPPLVILPHFYKQVAEDEGMRDLLEQSKAWDAFLRARREGNIKRKENPNAYFRGIVRKLVQQARIAAAEAAEAAQKAPTGSPESQQATLPIMALTPATEAATCRLWMQHEAAHLLAQGCDASETLHRLLRHPLLPRHTRLHAPRVDEMAALVDSVAPRAEELRRELERRRRTLEVSAETQAWLRRQHADLSTRKGSPLEQTLFGQPTLARIARTLVIQPGLPPDLREATPEQIEALLLKLKGST